MWFKIIIEMSVTVHMPHSKCKEKNAQHKFNKM